ncbi:MAG: hypothetical protein ABEK17_01770 [Candidatus Aenigmatarchaeota archaeon]
MCRRSKGQVSFEFIMLFSVLLTIFVLYIPIFAQQAQMIKLRREFLTARRIGLEVKKEVNMANVFGDGYKRNFTLEKNILGSDYTLKIKNNSRVLLLKWNNRTVAEEMITPEINGTINPGSNTILNQNGVINFI